MQQVPDLVVLDFLDWLLRKKDGNHTSFTDTLLDSENLYSEARDYLRTSYRQHRKDTCILKELLLQFILEASPSEQFHCYSWCPPHNDSKYYCLRKFEHEFFDFCERKGIQLDSYGGIRLPSRYEISPEALQWAASHFYEKTDTSTQQSEEKAVFKLMIETKTELNEILDFFEWTQKKPLSPGMPDEVLNRIIDGYIEETGKDLYEKNLLMNAFRQSGLRRLANKIERFIHSTSQAKSRELLDMLNRYSSRRARYNCVFLFPSMNHKQHKELVTHYWDYLNECSADSLDIFYSLKDIKKSGFSLVDQSNSFPYDLRYYTPGMLIWSDHMNQARGISFEQLNNEQIVSVVKTIAESIQKEKSFDDIIKEAENKVKEYQEQNTPKNNIVNYGNGNIIIGDNNNANSTSNVQRGNNNKSNQTVVSSSENTGLAKDFEKALKIIQDSQELDDDERNTLCKIFKEALESVKQQNEDGAEQAKQKFGYVKSFVIKHAPRLMATLADIVTVAGFFGLQLPAALM